MVPGFNSTGPAIINGTSTGNKYPDYTRVNHGKYAVSDKRAHIGTSNLMWDYFYAIVGECEAFSANMVLLRVMGVKSTCAECEAFSATKMAEVVM